MNEIFIDVGSSTIKAYRITGENTEHLKSYSIPFKKYFCPKTGISQDQLSELVDFLSALKNEYPNMRFKLFATAIWRKLECHARQSLVDFLFDKTGMLLNIIEHGLESFYLQTALAGKCPSHQTIMLINIGGGSTELIIIENGQSAETININIGVGSILTQYPSINEDFSGVSLEKVKDYIVEQLPALSSSPKLALYNGGELTYMQIANYDLEPNDLFLDKDHPYKINFQAFVNRNNDVFNKISLKELESLMPNNPKWMRGARACSAFAQAICEKYGIEEIVPSDSNLINGAIRQEFRTAVISGSFRKHLEPIRKIKRDLETMGVEVKSPRFTKPQNPGEEFVIFDGEEGLTPLELERHHLNSIKESDALIVCCPNGYVGASALIEVGYAQALGKRIIFSEQPQEFMLNTLPSEIGL